MTTLARTRGRWFHRAIALPQEHGTWAFLLVPLIIGLFAGERWSADTFMLVLAALDVFFLRQPVVMTVKVLSGRRPRHLLPVALLWTAVYGLFGVMLALWFWFRGMAYLFLLVVPALLVFAWHLWLVARRAERGQMGVEIVASGTLALAAPAAFWVGRGTPDPMGWLLWALAWFQSAASIVYAYLRLEQRRWPEWPPPGQRLRAGWRALLYTTFNMAAVMALAAAGVVPAWLWLAYAVQWGETVWGTLRPAVGWRPARIGVRQMVVSALFTLVFVVTWRLG